MPGLWGGHSFCNPTGRPAFGVHRGFRAEASAPIDKASQAVQALIRGQKAVA